MSFEDAVLVTFICGVSALIFIILMYVRFRIKSNIEKDIVEHLNVSGQVAEILAKHRKEFLDAVKAEIIRRVAAQIAERHIYSEERVEEKISKLEGLRIWVEVPQDALLLTADGRILLNIAALREEVLNYITRPQAQIHFQTTVVKQQEEKDETAYCASCQKEIHPIKTLDGRLICPRCSNPI